MKNSKPLGLEFFYITFDNMSKKVGKRCIDCRLFFFKMSYVNMLIMYLKCYLGNKTGRLYKSEYFTGCNLLEFNKG